MSGVDRHAGSLFSEHGGNRQGFVNALDTPHSSLSRNAETAGAPARVFGNRATSRRGSSRYVLLARSVIEKTATVLATVLFGTSLSCAREPCAQLDRYFGGPEAWRRHELEPRPRCAAADPSCGPEPTLALDQTCFRPKAERERLPLGEPAPAGPTYACSHDGDCQLAGSCGSACVAYRARDFTASCTRHDWLDENAFCGCVDGACSFFRQ
jgi:hypothetical protein